MQAQALRPQPPGSTPPDFALAVGLSPQGASHLMAISSLQRKAPGETLFCRRRRGGQRL